MVSYAFKVVDTISSNRCLICLNIVLGVDIEVGINYKT